MLLFFEQLKKLPNTYELWSLLLDGRAHRKALIASWSDMKMNRPLAHQNAINTRDNELVLKSEEHEPDVVESGAQIKTA